MDSGRDISDQTLSAITEVIAEELDGPFYAWKIHDAIENRVWLSLSQAEAAEWESVENAQVTIIVWQLV